MSNSILHTLREQKNMRMKGGLYHKIQNKEKKEKRWN